MKTDSLLSPALQRIRELHEEDYSQRDIVKFLQAEGVPLPPGRRQKWNLHGVQAALQQLAALPSPPSPPPAPPIAAVPPPAEGDPPPSASPSEPPPDPATPRRLNVKIQGPWIDTDSLLWEFLIHKVWDDLTDKTDHTIPLADALRGLRLTPRHRDPEHLWEALDRLVCSHVKLEGQLGSQLLSISTPLLSAVLTEESLSFQFPAALIKLVKNPQQYIRLKELFAGKN